MHRISVIGDELTRPNSLGRELRGLCEVAFEPLDAALKSKPGQCTLVDIDLNNDPQLLSVKEWLKHKPKDATVIFATDRASRLQETRAYALGATGIVHRPVNGRRLLTKLWGDRSTLESLHAKLDGEQPEAITAATNCLQAIFSAACQGTPVASQAIEAASESIVRQLEAEGLGAWINRVRMHHSETYQHCLLVTGLATAFGQRIGLSRKDCQRLSFAGMLHDVGKARIPLSILEKPGPLDKKEWVVMRKHPEYGIEALRSAKGLPDEMLDMVAHHHEYLDGSGYPHRLKGSEISDLVRIMTISDIFGALIERRAYRAPLTGPAAYQILCDMGPRLDTDLVRAFKFASLVDQTRE
jgi:putative nucleotidyltransferase with HDIG domain